MKNRFIAGLMILAAGCGQSDPNPQMDMDVLEKHPPEMVKATLVEKAKDEDVILLVKTRAAADGKSSTEVWVEQQVDTVKGQVMFPKWEVQRRTSYKYDVTYSYTLIQENNVIVKQGYRWSVDMMSKTVSSAEIWNPEIPSVKTYSPEISKDEQKKRIARERASLE